MDSVTRTEGDRPRICHLCRKFVPVADDSILGKAPPNVLIASFLFKWLTVIPGALVGMKLKLFGVINITELVEVFQYLHQVPHCRG